MHLTVLISTVLYYHRSDPRNPPISVTAFFLLFPNISFSSIPLPFFFSSFLLLPLFLLSYPYPFYSVYTLFFSFSSSSIPIHLTSPSRSLQRLFSALSTDLLPTFTSRCHPGIRITCAGLFFFSIIRLLFTSLLIAHPSFALQLRATPSGSHRLSIARRLDLRPHNLSSWPCCCFSLSLSVLVAR